MVTNQLQVSVKVRRSETDVLPLSCHGGPVMAYDDEVRWKLFNSTVIVAGPLAAVLDVCQVKLRHRDVFVLLDGVTLTRPDVHHLVLGVAIYR